MLAEVEGRAEVVFAGLWPCCIELCRRESIGVFEAAESEPMGIYESRLRIDWYGPLKMRRCGGSDEIVRATS